MKRFRKYTSPDCILDISSNSGTIRNKYENRISSEAEILTDCEVWYSGKKASSFILDGTSVDRWKDLSGNDRHCNNTNADATRPTWDASTGRVTFTSADSTFLQSATFASALTQPNTIFIVYKINTYINNSFILDGRVDGVNRNTFFLSSNKFVIFAGTLVSDGAVNTNDNIHVGLFNGVNSSYWINGVSVVDGDVGAGDMVGITLGDNFGLGNYYADCQIMEVIVYGVDISDYKRIGINNYLVAKWGVSTITPLPLVNTNTTVFKESELMAMKFDNTAKLDLGTFHPLTGDISMAVWYKPYTGGSADFGMIINNGKFICLVLEGTKTVWFYSDGLTGVSSAAGIINFRGWNFLTITRTSAGVTNFYVDGVLSGVADQDSGTPVAGSTNVFIGDRNADDRPYDGLIEPVTIYSKILSANEVSQIWSSEKKKYNK